MSEETKHPFIRPDENDPAVFWCDHPELKHQCRIRKLTFGREMERERIKGAAAGMAPTPDGLILAEWYASIKVGLELPESFVLEDVEDEALVEVLADRCARYWGGLRRN